MKMKWHIVVAGLALAIVLGGCSSPEAAEVCEPAMQPSTNPSPEIQAPKPPPDLPTNRVELVYFHLPQRCTTCLCFEERVTNLVKNSYQKDLESGKLVYRICDISDKNNADTVRKYNAFASQLCINLISDSGDNIVDIKDIWKWKCVGDPKGFDQNVKAVIDQNLKEVQ